MIVEQWHDSIKNSRKLARRLNGISLAAGLLGYIYPRPYEVVITFIALLPLAAIILMSRNPGLFDVQGRRHEKRPSLATAWFLPTLVLVLRALLDLQFVEVGQIIYRGIFFGTVVAAITFLADPKVRAQAGSAVTIIILSLVYGCGLTAYADTLFDHSKAQVFDVQVQKKRTTGSRSTTYHLQVSPWGPKSAVNEVTVGRALYRTVNVDDRVCVYLRPGTLGIPWFDTDTCSTDHG